VAAQLVASQAVLSSMELISYIIVSVVSFPKKINFQNINSVWCSVVSPVILQTVFYVSCTDNVHHR
jgi:hypothetical protein